MNELNGESFSDVAEKYNLMYETGAHGTHIIIDRCGRFAYGWNTDPKVKRTYFYKGSYTISVSDGRLNICGNASDKIPFQKGEKLDTNFNKRYMLEIYHEYREIKRGWFKTQVRVKTNMVVPSPLITTYVKISSPINITTITTIDKRIDNVGQIRNSF